MSDIFQQLRRVLEVQALSSSLGTAWHCSAVLALLRRPGNIRTNQKLLSSPGNVMHFSAVQALKLSDLSGTAQQFRHCPATRALHSSSGTVMHCPAIRALHSSSGTVVHVSAVQALRLFGTVRLCLAIRALHSSSGTVRLCLAIRALHSSSGTVMHFSAVQALRHCHALLSSSSTQALSCTSQQFKHSGCQAQSGAAGHHHIFYYFM